MKLVDQFYFVHSASYHGTLCIHDITTRKLLHDRPAESNKERVRGKAQEYISTFSTVLHFLCGSKEEEREKSLGGSPRILFSLILLNVTLLSIMRTIGMSPSMFVQRSWTTLVMKYCTGICVVIISSSSHSHFYIMQLQNKTSLMISPKVDIKCQQLNFPTRLIYFRYVKKNISR